MIRRPPRSTHCISSAASDVYKRQTLGPLKLRPPFTGASVRRFACANNSPQPSSTGQASARIRPLSCSHRPVFLVNSRLGLFSATPHRCGAPLLPKLRGHFAEFLDNISPVGLRILSSPTCVGLRYGHLRISLAAFLASVKRTTSLLVFGPHRPSASDERTSLPTSLWPCPDSTINPVCCSSCVPASYKRSDGGTGISACFPSATTLCPRLRPRLTLGG
eukprot:TRINITY_DN1834_c0_g1_i3.p1 TRINITY_DN1834_c0_g1~~TRINITY_DN1834_c0_g1_i3.p1  ORF type:complete len:219 (+),score=-46.83 TRINITY_DN1834_c0_g1_i3:118-774(+)